MKRRTSDPHYSVKVLEGVARNEAWGQLTSQQKLASLDKRLGKGNGATKQRKVLGK